MEDLKDKFKSLLKKPAKKFSGQGHRLGEGPPPQHALAVSASTGKSAAASSAQQQHEPGRQPQAAAGSSRAPRPGTNLQHEPTGAAAAAAHPVAERQELKPATEFSPFTAVIGGGAARTTINMNPEGYQAGNHPSSSPQPAEATKQPPQPQQLPKPAPAVRAEVGSAAVEEMQHCLALILSQQHVAASSLEVLQKLLSNLLAAPQEAKFRQLRLGPNPNPKIQACVLDVPGALDFLKACGFEVHADDEPGPQGETFAYFLDDTKLSYVDCGLTQLQLAMQPLHNDRQATQQQQQQQQPARQQPQQQHAGAASFLPQSAISDSRTAVQDRKYANSTATGGTATTTTAGAAAAALPAVSRNTLVLLPAAPDVDVPEWFFERTAAEVKAEFMSLLRQRQTRQSFASKAWKDLQLGSSSSSSGRKPSVVTLRVRFPEGVCLQGCFGVQEPATAVFDWVTHSLRDPGLTYELITPSRAPLAASGTVSSADLAGAVLNFRALAHHQHGYLVDAAGRQQPFLSDAQLALARAD